ncbi:acyl-CoA dehydrogenase family protein [Gordonia polyisoprenivorans]|uniref:Acyl-CoA/acyl-ACP dehydrogenase n=1 Tax=Gordonia polyisoprenivorans TaxID=84595 RepID=A0A846WTB9_9ACTN|nr:acyl-CoA dehydrogenase family protein [Gordonia polyisoprenivorans]NKY04948.1 acyl-CoA/acyl-ACP dehydrogenase [Gordonia polyisoprenivorans]UZF56360.1 acyl-CoA/acyl-ACP dehydrogenase [Gordonia polyisoprenivorans]
MDESLSSTRPAGTTPDISPDEVRAALRDYFATRPGLDEVRRTRDGRQPSGFDESSWRTLATDVGLCSLGMPPRWGGLGLGLDCLVAAVEECGAALYPGPVRAAVLAAWALGEGALGEGALGGLTDAVDLTGTIEGLFAGMAVPGSTLGTEIAEPQSLPLWRAGAVSGVLWALSHGVVAGLAVTEVRTDDGVAAALVILENSADRRSRPTVDFALPRADVTVTDAPALLVTEPGDTTALQRFRDASALLRAAEQVGGAQGCVSLMVEYAGVREQFGHPIGSYQAIAHRCAQTAVDVVGARGLVTAGAAALDRATFADPDTAVHLASLAHAAAGETYLAASSSLIQVSGGIGFTWEHDAHLHFRHARTLAVAGGTPAQYYDRAVLDGCLDLVTSGVGGNETVNPVEMASG